MGLGSSFPSPWQIWLGWRRSGCSPPGLCSGSRPSEICLVRNPLPGVALGEPLMPGTRFPGSQLFPPSATSGVRIPNWWWGVGGGQSHNFIFDHMGKDSWLYMLRMISINPQSSHSFFLVTSRRINSFAPTHLKAVLTVCRSLWRYWGNQSWGHRGTPPSTPKESAVRVEVANKVILCEWLWRMSREGWDWG